MAAILIPMVDGGIYEVYTDTDSYSGCSTCDYGSSYVTTFQVKMTSGRIDVEISNMYNYGVSEDFMMKLFLINYNTIQQMTEQAFVEWLRTEIEAELTRNYGEVDSLDYEFHEGW